jgi:hypothetical protein
VDEAEEYGVARLLDELASDLRSGRTDGPDPETAARAVFA